MFYSDSIVGEIFCNGKKFQCKIMATHKRRRDAEVKGMDTIIEDTGITATTNTNASSTVLNLVRQGTGSWQRVGNKAKLKSLRLKINGLVEMNPNATTGTVFGSTMRMVVVWDKQPSGVLPTFDTIFGKTTQDGTEVTAWSDPLKYDNAGRFHVIRDYQKTINPEIFNVGGGTTNDTLYAFSEDIYIDLLNKETVFSGQSAPMTIADISTGGLYLYFRADEAASNIIVWTILDTSMARLRYLD